MSEPKKFLSVKHIVFMIIVQVLAFNNIPRCYYQMGYSAIPILILAALLFFVPYSFMMAEYGSALRDEAGGLYNWMERSLGTKFAFCGSLLNYAGTLVWFMLVVASSEWVSLSAMISGGDTTGAWSILGLTSAQTLGISVGAEVASVDCADPLHSEFAEQTDRASGILVEVNGEIG